MWYKGDSMQSVVVNESGQITIPSMLMEKLGIEKGCELYLFESDGKLIIQNDNRDPLDVIQEELRGEAERVGWNSEEDVVKYIKELRKEMDYSKCESCSTRIF